MRVGLHTITHLGKKNCIRIVLGAGYISSGAKERMR